MPKLGGPGGGQYLANQLTLFKLGGQIIPKVFHLPASMIVIQRFIYLHNVAYWFCNFCFIHAYFAYDLLILTKVCSFQMPSSFFVMIIEFLVVMNKWPQKWRAMNTFQKTEWWNTYLLLTRRPVPSTDQALPSCFYFRISWILMKRPWKHFFGSCGFLQGLRS